MHKITIYLPDDLRAAVQREARHLGIAEAEVTRRAVATAVTRPAPTPGLFASDVPLASRIDELLAGFGDR